MIVYNNRYRGPFEYDKFALNILSFHNIINDLETFEIRGTNEEIESLKSINEEIDCLYKKCMDNNGLNNRIKKEILKERKNATL